MCKQCVTAVRKHWPDLSDDQYGDLLWCCTAFPFASPEVIESQLEELARLSGCDIEKAKAIADSEIDRIMGEPDRSGVSA